MLENSFKTCGLADNYNFKLTTLGLQSENSTDTI